MNSHMTTYSSRRSDFRSEFRSKNKAIANLANPMARMLSNVDAHLHELTLMTVSSSFHDCFPKSRLARQANVIMIPIRHVCSTVSNISYYFTTRTHCRHQSQIVIDAEAVEELSTCVDS